MILALFSFICFVIDNCQRNAATGCDLNRGSVALEVRVYSPTFLNRLEYVTNHVLVKNV